MTDDHDYEDLYGYDRLTHDIMRGRAAAVDLEFIARQNEYMLRELRELSELSKLSIHEEIKALRRETIRELKSGFFGIVTALLAIIFFMAAPYLRAIGWI
ncbi:MAG: hypothetical protein WBW74_13865 [Xanthobacteraceae bacterium]